MRGIPARLFSAVLTILTTFAAFAERAPVLKQIDVPHDYYFREMYLPHVTTGQTSPAWSPDGKTLVYSMQGSLWRQGVDSGTAVQLTNGPGYDYQPDWSPDGESIVFVRYDDDALELWLLDVASGKAARLTRGGDVNTEPRFSPDGSRLAFISTTGSGRFHLFTGTLDGTSLDAAAVFEERKSDVARYYYSAWDHELSPSWSPDGESILYVANPEVPYGTGGIWKVDPGGDREPALVHSEETTWRARPDWSPDGKRFVFASYLGRPWHQLWADAVEGGAEPFPLTYGDYDVSSPRWSPDGARIAYVVNESGNTSLRIQEVPGGKVTELGVDERRYLSPMGELEIASVDRRGHVVPARVSVVASDGRSYAPADVWMHADDGFDRDVQDFETHYFHTRGKSTVTLPPGPARITVWRGLENAVENRLVTIRAREATELSVVQAPLAMPDGWSSRDSGDVHVHMNYGGTYRDTPRKLVRQAAAEDLDFVFNLVVNKEQRIPDIDYFSTEPDDASTRDVILLHAQEFHTSYWGHLGVLRLDDHLLIPDYAAYPGTAAASLYPDNAAVADLAHRQGAAVGYVHPFAAPPPDPESDAPLTSEFPIDVALGKVDYYEVVGFADHRASAAVWYRLLNLGFRIPAAAGTDAMANYASLRGPVGLNRVYVDMPRRPRDAAERRDAWLEGLKAGHTLATNGPLLGLTVEGSGPGDEIERPAGLHALAYSGFLRSIVPVDHLELVYNGEVVKSLDTGADRTTADFEGSIDVRESGWLLLRAWNDGAHPLIFDIYPYATTSPVFVTVGGAPPQSPEDAEYFLAWIERVRDAAAEHPDYNTGAERAAVLGHLDDAAQVFLKLAE